MFLLFGTRASEKVMNVMTFICAYCGVHAEQDVITRRNRLTLFFVPLFPLSTMHFAQCTNCRGNDPSHEGASPALPRVGPHPQERQLMTWSSEEPS